MDKLTALIATIQADRSRYFEINHPVLVSMTAPEPYETIGFDEGPKFFKVWGKSGSSRSVKLFVEKSTGNIFGAKSWKAYNPARQFGTLDTVAEWDWSGYYPASKTGLDTLVPKGTRRTGK